MASGVVPLGSTFARLFAVRAGTIAFRSTSRRTVTLRTGTLRTGAITLLARRTVALSWPAFTLALRTEPVPRLIPFTRSEWRSEALAVPHHAAALREPEQLGPIELPIVVAIEFGKLLGERGRLVGADPTVAIRIEDTQERRHEQRPAFGVSHRRLALRTRRAVRTGLTFRTRLTFGTGPIPFPFRTGTVPELSFGTEAWTVPFGTGPITHGALTLGPLTVGTNSFRTGTLTIGPRAISFGAISRGTGTFGTRTLSRSAFAFSDHPSELLEVDRVTSGALHDLSHPLPRFAFGSFIERHTPVLIDVQAAQAIQ